MYACNNYVSDVYTRTTCIQLINVCMTLCVHVRNYKIMLIMYVRVYTCLCKYVSAWACTDVHICTHVLAVNLININRTRDEADWNAVVYQRWYVRNSMT